MTERLCRCLRQRTHRKSSASDNKDGKPADGKEAGGEGKGEGKGGDHGKGGGGGGGVRFDKKTKPGDETESETEDDVAVKFALFNAFRRDSTSCRVRPMLSSLQSDVDGGSETEDDFDLVDPLAEEEVVPTTPYVCSGSLRAPV